MSAIAFWVLAALAVANGFAVFRLGSMARVTFALLASFLAAAGELLLLGLSYLGLVFVLMMTIEMTIMVVFMVMYMMNPAGLMPMAMFHNRRGALAISTAVFVLLGAGAFLVPWPSRDGRVPADPTLALGRSLMGPQMLTMMTLGFALLATIVATVVLSTRRGRYDRFGDDLRAARPDDPIRGGLPR